MALYESLTSQSTPEEIAAAYKEFAGTAGGDTQKTQEAAVNYLTNLGISAPTIESAYGSYLSGQAPTTGGALSTVTTPTSNVVTPTADSGALSTSQSATTAPVDTGPTLTYYTGQKFQGNQVLNLAEQLASATRAGDLKGGVFGTTGQSIGFDFDQAKTLLGDNTKIGRAHV